jgi:hypothetical protein
MAVDARDYAGDPVCAVLVRRGRPEPCGRAAIDSLADGTPACGLHLAAARRGRLTQGRLPLAASSSKAKLVRGRVRPGVPDPGAAGR